MHFQVCHHPDCQDLNGHQPVLFCQECDQLVHSKQEANHHLRFDVLKKGGECKQRSFGVVFITGIKLKITKIVDLIFGLTFGTNLI